MNLQSQILELPCTIVVYAKAGAAKSQFLSKHNDGYKIAIAAVADKGKANAELIKFIEKELKDISCKVTIISGHTSKKKLVKIEPKSKQ